MIFKFPTINMYYFLIIKKQLFLKYEKERDYKQESTNLIRTNMSNEVWLELLRKKIALPDIYSSPHQTSLYLLTGGQHVFM